MPKFRLSDLDLDFISLVPAGDDPLAQVVIAKVDPDIAKRDGHKSKTHPSLERAPGKKDNWVEGVGGLPSYIERIAKHLHYDRGMTIGHAIAAAITQCRKWAAGGEGVKPDTQAKAARALAQWEAKKAKSKAKRVNKSGETTNPSLTLSSNRTLRGGNSVGEPNDITKDDLPVEVVQYIESLEDTVDDLTQKVEKAEADIATLQKAAEDADTLSKSDPNTDFDAILAKADPAVATILKAQREQLQQAEAIAKAERDARLDREFISKAESLPMIANEKTELASLLREAAEKLTPESVTKLEGILKAANEQIAKGNLFSEFGTGGGETTVSKSVDAAAEAIRKADPSLTIEQARAKAFEMNPDLYTEAMKEATV